MNIDVVSSALKLAQILKEEPSLVEKPLLSAGDKLIAIYQDANFKDSFRDFKSMKIEAIKVAIDDVAMGCKSLQESTIGLTFRDNKVQTFITTHGKSPGGSVMFSISWKNMIAFKNYRNMDGEIDIPEEELHAVIYRLTHELSTLL